MRVWWARVQIWIWWIGNACIHYISRGWRMEEGDEITADFLLLIGAETQPGRSSKKWKRKEQIEDECRCWTATSNFIQFILTRSNYTAGEDYVFSFSSLISARCPPGGLWCICICNQLQTPLKKESLSCWVSGNFMNFVKRCLQQILSYPPFSCKFSWYNTWSYSFLLVKIRCQVVLVCWQQIRCYFWLYIFTRRSHFSRRSVK